MSRTSLHVSTLMLASMVVCCTCASLGAVSGSTKGNQQGFGQYGSPSHFQSWQEWAKKRNLGRGSAGTFWGQGLLSGNDFQDWREFMSKRGYNIPDSVRTPWAYWIKRQGLGNTQRNPFPSQDYSGQYGNFQKWGDWFNKRSAGMPPFSRGQDSFPAGAGSGMQTWDEFMKRKGFGFSSSAPFGANPQPQSGALQSWQEWAKRKGPFATSGGRWGSFGKTDFGLVDQNQMMDWESMFKHTPNKRQLGHTPHSFGTFNRYFTDGLQDWRSTFKGSKREAAEDQASAASARDGSGKNEAQ